jgi:hypothetical protein
MQYVQFAIDNYAEIVAILGAAYALLSAFVAVTPSTADDAALMRVAQRISFLSPRNVPGRFSLPGKAPGKPEDSIGPMLVVLLCFAPLVGGCGHVPMPDTETATAMARIVACKACAALGGEKGEACAAVLGCEP